MLYDMVQIDKIIRSLSRSSYYKSYYLSYALNWLSVSFNYFSIFFFNQSRDAFDMHDLYDKFYLFI